MTAACHKNLLHEHEDEHCRKPGGNDAVQGIGNGTNNWKYGSHDRNKGDF